MESYEEKVERVRKEVEDSGIVAECLYGAGQACQPRCSAFGDCWIKGRRMENAPLEGVANSNNINLAYSL